MSALKKLLEKPIKAEDIEKIKWLYRGIVTIDEKGRKAALEKDVEFMEKEGRYLTPEEFHAALFNRPAKDVPTKYKDELERYQNLFVNSLSDFLNIGELRDTKLGKMIGIPNARENLFELKKKGKRIGFVHVNEKLKTIDFITELEELPAHFKKKMEE